MIAPGDNETVKVTVDVSYIAGYDSTFENADGTTGTYILDEGIIILQSATALTTRSIICLRHRAIR